MTATPAAPAPELTFDEMYAALRRIAQAAMRGERASHTLQPTALVHDYLLSLPEGLPASPAEMVEVVRRAGWRMRRYLIDYARQRQRHHPESVASTRVGLEAVDGSDVAVTFPDLELLDDLLRELQAENPEATAVVEVRFFCGLICHGDLKPSNGLVGLAGRVKVVDFGAVLEVSADVASPRAWTPGPYAAPELYLDGQPERRRADVYALGVLAFQMLTGELPSVSVGRGCRGATPAEIGTGLGGSPADGWIPRAPCWGLS